MMWPGVLPLEVPRVVPLSRLLPACQLNRYSGWTSNSR